MNNFNKTITVNTYSLGTVPLCLGTEKSYGFEKISFSFSSEWSGLFKTVTFYPPKKKPVSIEGIEAGVEYDVPAEVTARGGVGEYAVSGYADGKKLYSVSGTFEVLSSRSEQGVAPDAPTPSEIDQIRQYALDAKNAAEESDIAYIKQTPSTEDGGENIVEIGLKNGETYKLVVLNGSKGKPGDATDIGLEAGEAEYSVKQSRHPDSSQNHAYQRGGVALGGNTQAGVTEEEYNASDKYKQWDGTKFLEFLETFGFQLTWGDGSKARGRNSMAGNEGCEANAKNSTALGLKVIVDFLNGFGCGMYNENLADSIFEVGVGNKGWKQNGLAIDTNGTTKTRTVRPKASASFNLGDPDFRYLNLYTFNIDASSSIIGNRVKSKQAPAEDTDVVRLKELNAAVGDIETALDGIIAQQESIIAEQNSIIAIQEALIGGVSE